MATYSIKELEQLSGIKAHTIRIWEQRHHLLMPTRSKTNIRSYDDEQLRKLLNISTLVSLGVKISAIAELTEEEINQRISSISIDQHAGNARTIAIINQLIAHGLTYDQPNFESTFSSAVLQFGLKDTYIKVIYPMLVRIGLMWSTRDLIPAQEHFISNLIKQKLFTAIDTIPNALTSDETWVLFLPEGEDHELGLVFANYLLRQAGKNVIYLGQRVPYLSLKSVIEDTKPAGICFFTVVHQPLSSLQMLIDTLENDFPELAVWISGSQYTRNQLNTPDNFSWKHSVEDFI